MEDNKWSPLMEQNWKRMQIILDQELPIKNDKRRSLLFSLDRQREICVLRFEYVFAKRFN